MAGFEDIYLSYFGDVYRYALGLTKGDEALAEDITSDSFLKAMNAIDTFRGECALRVWLCQIAKRCWLDYLRRQGRLVSLDALRDIPDEDGGAERFFEKEQAMDAHRSLHCLPEPYREVFSLRVLGALSFAQIGELFQKSANWACVTYHRARHKLREGMEEEK